MSKITFWSCHRGFSFKICFLHWYPALTAACWSLNNWEKPLFQAPTNGLLTLLIKRTSFSLVVLLSSVWPTCTSLSCCHWHSLPHSIPFWETENFQFEAFNGERMITKICVELWSYWKGRSGCPGLFSVDVGLWLAQPWWETVLEIKQHPQHWWFSCSWSMKPGFFIVVCEGHTTSWNTKKFRLEVMRNLFPTKVAYPWSKGQGSLSVSDSGSSSILTVQSPGLISLVWSYGWACSETSDLPKRLPCQLEFSCSSRDKQNIILAAANCSFE